MDRAARQMSPVHAEPAKQDGAAGAAAPPGGAAKRPRHAAAAKDDDKPPPAPPLRRGAAPSIAVVGHATLHTAAMAALLTAAPLGCMLLPHLRLRVTDALNAASDRLLTVSEAALREALEAAPQTYQLARQFVDGVPRTMVHLLLAGGQRMALTPLGSPADKLYRERVHAWLSAQQRWCLDAEVLREVPLPPLPDGTTAAQYLRAATAVPDVFATAHSGRYLAALRDGAPPAPPPSRDALREAEANELSLRARPESIEGPSIDC